MSEKKRVHIRFDHSQFQKLETVRNELEISTMNNFITQIADEYLNQYYLNKNFSDVTNEKIQAVVNTELKYIFNNHLDIFAKLALNTLHTRFLLEEVLRTVDFDTDIIEETKKQAVYELKNYEYAEILELLKGERIGQYGKDHI